jgi:hypothetical protein
VRRRLTGIIEVVELAELLLEQVGAVELSVRAGDG